MTCSELVELITAFLDDALDDETEMALLTHLDTCELCRGFLEQHRQTVRILGRTAPPPTLAPARRAELLAAFRAARC